MIIWCWIPLSHYTPYSLHFSQTHPLVFWPNCALCQDSQLKSMGNARLLTVGTQNPASAADSSLASHACGVCKHTCLASLAFSSCDTICVQREYKCQCRTTHKSTWMFGIRFFNWVSAHINNNVHIFVYYTISYNIYFPLWFTSSSC